MTRTILVAGALGVIGRALVEHCESDPDVEIVGLARRSPELETSATFISVDLLNRGRVRAQAGSPCRRHPHRLCGLGAAADAAGRGGAESEQIGVDHLLQGAMGCRRAG
jgi:nucleoside-diphosphate-sugar epimerase